MSNRKAIPKKIRFEVFKRDKFTCRYCGRKAPDVILELDHVVPVAEGGGDEILNLVTACRDCNRGKGKRLLDDLSEVHAQRQALEDLQERREQMRMIMDWKRELNDLRNEMLATVNDYLCEMTGFQASAAGESELRQLLERFGFEEVIEAMEISFSKYYIPQDVDSMETAFRKIGGICYNRSIGRTADYYSHGEEE